MRGLLGLLVVGLIALSTAAHAEPPEGDWLGVMTAPTFGDLTMALHLRKTGAAYEGTMDDVTLGMRGLTLKGIEASGERLAFDVPAARARYEATWNATDRQWIGLWKGPGSEQGLPLRLARGLAPPAPVVMGLDGDWQGALNVGPAGLLRLVFHVRTRPDGTFVTLDSLDQGTSGAPASAIRRTGDQVEIDFPLLKAQVAGRLSQDGGSIQGEFTQGPALFPLALKRGGDVVQLPQSGDPSARVGPWRLPDDAAIRQILTRRIDVERRSVGVVVGLISPAGRRVVSYGALDTSGRVPVNADTLFEIGSITKTFTALLLQDMVLRGEVSLDDPVSRYLPPGAQAPSFGDRQITLRQLATHTAALPHDLPSPGATRMEDVFSHTSEADLYRFLATYQLPREPGAQWEYSNLGVGLLGVALSRRSGLDLESLIRARITGPLGMTSTGLAIPPSQQARLATGHDAYLRPVAAIAIGPAEAAAGQLRSSANDMLKLLAAELGYVKTPLKPAMDAMLTVDQPGMSGVFRQSLGWMVLNLPTGQIVTHSGGTFGQRAFAAFNRKTREGVVVLTNAEGTTGADDIGLHLIAGAPLRPLPPAPPPRSLQIARPEVPLSADAAAPYLGRYRMSRSIVMLIGYADGHLTYQAEARGQGGPVLPVAWHGDDDFSAANGGGDRADITFERDAAGAATAFVWRGPAGEFLLRRAASGD
jgi:CubicO group peptidase (beta-lactamase class C family)